MQKDPLLAAVTKRDLPAFERALDRCSDRIPARVVLQAAALAWKPGLAALVRHGADLNASYRNYRPIHNLIQERPHGNLAASASRVSCLKWLLAHGADPELTGAWPAARAIIIAAFVGEKAYVEALMANGAKRDIFAAAALGELKKAKALLQRDPSLASARDHGLLTALQCCGGSRLGRRDARLAARLVEIARLLVEAGADVHAKTPSWGHEVDVAHFVVGSGQVEILKLLLDHGLDPTTAVAPAVWDAREAILDLLLERGARIDEAFDHQRPLLNELVRWGQFKQARLLLARGASPNVADDKGWTALHQATSRGNVRMLRDLLAAGGDPMRRDREGFTPRDIARFKLRRDLVEILS